MSQRPQRRFVPVSAPFRRQKKSHDTTHMSLPSKLSKTANTNRHTAAATTMQPHTQQHVAWHGRPLQHGIPPFPRRQRRRTTEKPQTAKLSKTHGKKGGRGAQEGPGKGCSGRLACADFAAALRRLCGVFWHQRVAEEGEGHVYIPFGPGAHPHGRRRS